MPTTTLALPITPGPPLVTVQVWLGLVGCCATTMSYAEPLVSERLKSLPLSDMALLLFCRTMPVPSKPVIVPLRVKLCVTQLTATLLTLAIAVPEPLLTVQSCVGALGCTVG